VSIAGSPGFVTINEIALELVINTPEVSDIGTYTVTVDLIDDNE